MDSVDGLSHTEISLYTITYPQDMTRSLNPIERKIEHNSRRELMEEEHINKTLTGFLAHVALYLADHKGG